MRDGTSFDALIVGGGPAGLSAALVLGRCRRRILLCDSGAYRNANSQALHCFLGHDGIKPALLLESARRQLARYDCVTLRNGKITELGGSADCFRARVDETSVRARAVIVASGVVDELPRVEGLEPLFGRSVHVCPYCDGWENKDSPIAVYGRGGKGVGLALLLRQWTADLVLFTDGPAELTGEENARLSESGIRIVETPVRRLTGQGGCLEAVHLVDGAVLPRKALFFNTGQHPRSPLLDRLGCAYGENGLFACDEEGRTSVEGVYVAGDVSRDVQLAIIAAAEGARAALALNKDLLRRDGQL